MSPEEGSLCTHCGERFAPVGLDVGSTLWESFRILLQHPRALAAFCSAAGVFGLVTLPLTYVSLDTPLDEGVFHAARVGFLLATTAFSAMTYPLFIRFLGDVLTGRERSPGEIISEGLGRVRPMLWLTICLWIVLAIGFVMCVAPAIFLGVGLAISAPALVLHPLGPIKAMIFSWAFTEGHRMKVFLLLLICGGSCIGMTLMGGVVSSLISPLLGQLGMAVGSMLSHAIQALGIALMLSILVRSYLQLSGRLSLATETD